MKAARRVVPDSAAASLPPRTLAFAVAAIPCALAICFWPTLQSAFLVPKSALLIIAATLLCTALPFTNATSPVATNSTERSFLFAIVLFLAAALISAAFSPHRDLALQPVLFLVAGALLMPLAAAFLRNRPEWLLHGIAIAGAAVSLIAIGNRFGVDVFTPFGLHANYSAGRMQIASTLGNPNFVAAFVASCSSATLALALQRTRSAWGWRIALALSLIAVYLTQSRLGILALTIALVLPLLLQKRRGYKRLAITLLVLFAALASQINLTNPRTLSTASIGRTIIWRSSLQDGLHPLGDGPGTFAYLYPARLGRWFAAHSDPAALPFADPQTHVHNDYLEFFVETGYLGGLALLIALSLGLSALIQRQQVFAFGGISALLLSACFDFPLHRAETWALLWLWFSLIFLTHPEPAPQTKRSWPIRFIAVLALPVAALAILPVLSSYHVHEAQAYESQSTDSEAVTEYQRALHYDPTNPDANFYLARALANAGNPQAALQQTKIAEHSLDEPELYELRARILLQLGQRDQALATLRDAQRRFPYSQSLVRTTLEFQTAP